MSEWGYCNHNGPHTWKESFPLALGNRQSPIDICTADGCVQDEELTHVPLTIEYLTKCKLITNTGSGWKIGVSGTGSLLEGGPLGNDKYRLQQFHCHWGKVPEEGSEHTVDGTTFSGEIHLVHWNEKYGSFDDAVDKEDGLAVLGVFFQVGQEHPELLKIEQLLPNIEHNGDNFFIEEEINPAAFLPVSRSYWTYGGSLTTPPCLESVTWIVFKEPIEVSKEQLEAFRKLRSYGRLDAIPEDEFEGQILANYRPPLEVGARTVRSCDFK